MATNLREAIDEVVAEIAPSIFESSINPRVSQKKFEECLKVALAKIPFELLAKSDVFFGQEIARKALDFWWKAFDGVENKVLSPIIFSSWFRISSYKEALNFTKGLIEDLELDFAPTETKKVAAFIRSVILGFEKISKKLITSREIKIKEIADKIKPIMPEDFDLDSFIEKSKKASNLQLDTMYSLLIYEIAKKFFVFIHGIEHGKKNGLLKKSGEISVIIIESHQQAMCFVAAVVEDLQLDFTPKEMKKIASLVKLMTAVQRKSFELQEGEK